MLPPGISHEALARSSFLYYFSRVWGLTPYQHIQAIIQKLENTERQVAVVLPPGFAKSTVISQLYPSWYIGNHPDRSIILISSTDKQAKLFLNANRETMEHDDRWRSVFPDVAPDQDRGWSGDGLFVKYKRDPHTGLALPDWKSAPATQKDPNMVAFGIGGPVIGRRGDLILVDDPYSQDVARSDVQREEFSRWFRQTLQSRLKPVPWAKIVVCLTRWHPADIVSEMQELNRLEEEAAKSEKPGR